MRRVTPRGGSDRARCGAVPGRRRRIPYSARLTRRGDEHAVRQGQQPQRDT